MAARPRVQNVIAWSAVLIVLSLSNIAYLQAVYRLGFHGRSDFIAFYAVGSLVAEHRGASLYSARMQTAKQAELFPKLPAGRVIFNHLPYEALIFAPLSRLPYRAAYLAWVIVRILLLIITYSVLLRHFERLRPCVPWLLLLLLGFPTLTELMIGQDTILVFCLYALAFDALARGKQFRAGCFLGIALFKFHLVLPFMIPFFRKSRRKVLAGFVLASVAVLLISVSVVGIHGAKAYATMIAGMLHASAAPGYTMLPNLHGFLFSSLTRYLNNATLDALMLVCSLLTLFLFLRYVPDEAWDDPPRMPLVFSLDLLIMLLVSYFTHVYDLALLAFPVLALANRGVDHRPIRALLMAAVVLGAPLYMVTLAYRQIQLQIVILFLLVLGIALALRARPPTKSSAQERMLDGKGVANIG